MSFLIVAEGVAGGPAGGVTTGAVDTTGANLIVLAVAYYTGSGTPPVISDSKSNTWTALTDRQSANQGCRLYSCVGPTVGTGHTFSATGVSTFPVLGYIVASGSAASPYHSENGATSGGATSLQPGSVTPPENGCLVVSGLNFAGGSGASIGSGFTANAADYNPGSSIAGGIARLIQGTAAAVNPTWSWVGTDEAAAGIAVFRPGAATAGSGGFPLIGPGGPVG